MARYVVAAVVTALALLWAAYGVPAAYADSGGTLTIQVPEQPEGPVGTNVTIAAEGANPNDNYQIGYAGSGDCTSGFHGITGATAQAAADGTFTATFAWPSQANHVGTQYAVCAQDTTNSGQVLQAGQTFRVDATAPPSVAVAAATPGQGTPAAPGYTPGGEVVVSGHGFFPGGQQLEALVLPQKANGAAQLNSGTPLTLLDGTTKQFPADGRGDFQMHLRLPQSVTQGKNYLYVVTTDGTASTLPALVAYTTLTISSATPTVTATATATPVTPTPTTTGATTGDNNSGGGPGKDIAVFGLGGLSALLLVLGVIFLASAAALPQPEQGYGRTGPGQVRPPTRP